MVKWFQVPTFSGVHQNSIESQNSIAWSIASVQGGRSQLSRKMVKWFRIFGTAENGSKVHHKFMVKGQLLQFMVQEVNCQGSRLKVHCSESGQGHGKGSAASVHGSRSQLAR